MSSYYATSYRGYRLSASISLFNVCLTQQQRKRKSIHDTYSYSSFVLPMGPWRDATCNELPLLPAHVIGLAYLDKNQTTLLAYYLLLSIYRAESTTGVFSISERLRATVFFFNCRYF